MDLSDFKQLHEMILPIVTDHICSASDYVSKQDMTVREKYSVEASIHALAYAITIHMQYKHVGFLNDFNEWKLHMLQLVNLFCDEIKLETKETNNEFH